nr:hypothetical protein [Acidobacteriota bacterium]
GIGTDRFIVAWRIAGDRGRKWLDSRGGGPAELSSRFAGAPLANPQAVAPAGAATLPDAAWVRIEVPGDIQRLKVERPEEAERWRASTRHAFESYLARGYEVLEFYREPVSGRCFYALRARGSRGGET